jgi:hypothetical protein
MALKCGIIGMTNSGKTTILNCVSNTKAEATNFAYSTNKSNIGIINVIDPRLEKINSFVNSKKVTPATVDIIDIPGLAKGSNSGEGIGNQFLADIQQTNALIHVLRCFEDENLPHVEGSIDPVRDMEIVDLELQARDLDLVTRKIERLQKIAKSGDKEAKHGIEVLQKLTDHLENFGNVRDLELKEDDRKKFVDDMYLLTDKPIMYVCNVEDVAAKEGNAFVEKVKQALADQETQIVVVAGKLEAEIAELETASERAEFLEDAGLEEPSVNKVVRSAYSLLNLQSFFTAGEKEVRAWTVHKGDTAPEAAGVIHSDLQRGFIRAEVIAYEDYVAFEGSEAKLREAGKLRLEGKNYVVQDGDVLNIRFNV